MNIDSETGIWSLEIAKKRHKIDKVLAKAIYACYQLPIKAVDIGCGTGLYCSFFSALGWDIVGIEGTKGIRAIQVCDNILEMDLTKSLNASSDYVFDFALCLEVGEHIPKQHELQFINNICQMSNKHLVLSWAVPGQYSASGHVNCQSNEYVISKFWEKDFRYNASKTKLLRERAKFNWFKNTLMCFEKKNNG